MCEECHKVQEKTLLKPFSTIDSPWRSAQTAIMGNTIKNCILKKYLLKNTF